MLHAQRLVEHAAGSADNITLAKMAAEAAVRGFYAEFGWHVEVIWGGGGPEPQVRLEATSGSPSTVDRARAKLLGAQEGLPFRIRGE